MVQIVAKKKTFHFHGKSCFVVLIYNAFMCVKIPPLGKIFIEAFSSKIYCCLFERLAGLLSIVEV